MRWKKKKAPMVWGAYSMKYPGAVGFQGRNFVRRIIRVLSFYLDRGCWLQQTYMLLLKTAYMSKTPRSEGSQLPVCRLAFVCGKVR